MSDEELDRDWKPNGRRPQSTIARSFSQELMDIFRIENSVADLDEQVERRKKQITTQTSELEAIEARLREMEKRLKPGNTTDDQQRQSDNSQPQPGTEGDGASARQAESNLGAAQAQEKGSSRPGTAKQSQQAVPGALPPTPVASEDGDH